MPNCRDMSELVTDYMERALPPRRRLGVRWHLLLCRACRAYFAQIRETVGLLSRMPGQPPPSAAEARLLGRLPPHGADKPG